MPRTLPLLIGLAAVASETAADELFLRRGGRLVGDVVRREPTALVVDLDIGQVTVPLDQIEHINPGVRTPYALYRDRAAALAPGDVQGWMSLALWARASGLDEPARRAFARVVAADPDNAAAHQGLGHVRLGGRWLTVDEAYRAQGYVRHRGRWMTPPQRDAAQREEAARAREGRERRERQEREDRERVTAARLRELEARVKEAEARARTAEERARQVEEEARGCRHEHGRRSRRQHRLLPTFPSTPDTFAHCRIHGRCVLCVPADACRRVGTCQSAD